MKGKIRLIQILLIFTVVMVIINVIDDRDNNRESKNDFADLKEQISEVDENYEDREDISYTENGMIAKYSVLYQQNNDFVGWIKIDGTKIDYPIMQNQQTNAYYLHRNFNRDESNSGIPFLDYQCSISPTSGNMIVYGHNMKNGEMFHDLLKYQDVNFYKENKTVYFDTLYEVGEYEIFSVMRTKVGAKNEFKYYEHIDFNDETSFDSYIETCLSKSLYKTGVDVKFGDKILTMSTCSYNTDNERFVVFCKKKQI